MNQTFGQQLRDYRKSKGLRIDAVAEHLGISVGHLSNIERGKAPPLPRDLCSKFEMKYGPAPAKLWRTLNQEIKAHNRAADLAQKLKSGYMKMPPAVRDAVEALITGKYEE